MARPTEPEPQNNAGVLFVIFMMVAAISYAAFSAVSIFVSAKFPKERNERRLCRLISGVANVGNGVVHALLIMNLHANSQSALPFYVGELAEGLGGPIFLMVVNTLVGLSTLSGGGPKLALYWNTFVIFAGTLIPMVWLRFLEVGLATWPYVVIFIWLGIFACELSAFATSATWWALSDL